MGFKRSKFIPHPDGVTEGEFVDHKEVDGDYGKQTMVLFDTDEEMEDGKPFRIGYYITPEKVNPKSNAFKFLTAMQLNPDEMSDEEIEAIDLDDLLNRRCQLVVKHEKQKDGSIRAKVSDLLPLKPRRAKGASAQAPAETRQPVGAGVGTAAKPDLFNDEDE